MTRLDPDKLPPGMSDHMREQIAGHSKGPLISPDLIRAAADVQDMLEEPFDVHVQLRDQILRGAPCPLVVIDEAPGVTLESLTAMDQAQGPLPPQEQREAPNSAPESEPDLSFRLDIIPPRGTAQGKGIRVVEIRGRQTPMLFDKKPLKDAKKILTAALLPHVPAQPFTGPIMLRVVWCFPWRKAEPKKNRAAGWAWKETLPDLDNLNKALADIMTKQGYWKDDGQIAWLNVQKRYEDSPGILIQVRPLTGPAATGE